MEDLVRKGKARTVGVSNFSITELKDILPHATDVPISCNQIEVHPWLPQTALIDFCKSQDILVTCYSPFAGQKKSGEKLIEDPTVKELAKKNGLGEGQLLQSWAVQRGMFSGLDLSSNVSHTRICPSRDEQKLTCLFSIGTVPLGKSSDPARIKANLSVVRLSDEDFEKLNALEKKGNEGRTIDFTEAFGVPLFTN